MYLEHVEHWYVYGVWKVRVIATSESFHCCVAPPPYFFNLLRERVVPLTVWFRPIRIQVVFKLAWLLFKIRLNIASYHHKSPVFDLFFFCLFCFFFVSFSFEVPPQRIGNGWADLGAPTIEKAQDWTCLRKPFLISQECKQLLHRRGANAGKRGDRIELGYDILASTSSLPGCNSFSVPGISPLVPGKAFHAWGLPKYLELFFLPKFIL